MDWFQEIGIKIVVIIGSAIVVFMILRHLINVVVKEYLLRTMEDEDEEEIRRRIKTLSSILKKILTFFIVVIIFVTVLPILGIDVLALVTSLGIGGLAVSFAAQHLVRDFISGFFIILEDQYRIKDMVTIAGIEGEVENITLRRTVLRDSNGYVHSIPNEKVEISTNQTKKYSRVNMIVTVGYGENLKNIIEKINTVCKEMSEDPQWQDSFITTPSVLRIDKLGESGVDIKISGDTVITKERSIMGELRFRLKNTFDDESIEMPWPHTKIYFGNKISIRKEDLSR